MANEIKKIAGKVIINENFLGTKDNAIKLHPSAEASGKNSLAEGEYTKAFGENQHVEGKFNIEDNKNKYVHIVGNGTNENSQSNAHTLDWEGNSWYQGLVKIGGTSYDDADELATKKYVDNNIGGPEGCPTYQSINLDTTITGIKNGLAKFTLTGLVQPSRYNMGHGNVSGKYIPLYRTIGTLNVKNDSDEIINSVFIDLFGRDENAKSGFSEAKDEFTETYHKRVWSNDFFLSSGFKYDKTTCTNTENTLHTLTIPISEFGDEIPKQNGNIECICSAGEPKSVDELKAYTFPDTDPKVNLSKADIYPYLAMEYDENKENIYLYILTLKAYTKTSIFNSQIYIKYELETPVYEYHNFKMYLDNE